MDKIKPLFTATATASGGRNGHTKSSDHSVAADLSVPKEMGGPGKAGTTTPEHLFAAGYAACFGGALDLVAKQQKKDASKAKVICAVSIGPRDGGGFGLAVKMRIVRDHRCIALDELLMRNHARGTRVASRRRRYNSTVGDRECMAFSGAMVVSGRGTGIVVATGNETELGRINALLAGVSTLETPLLRQIKKFGYAITAVIGIVVVIVFAYGKWVKGIDFVELFQAVVGIAVSVIPKGLLRSSRSTQRDHPAAAVERGAARVSCNRRLLKSGANLRNISLPSIPENTCKALTPMFRPHSEKVPAQHRRICGEQSISVPSTSNAKARCFIKQERSPRHESSSFIKK